MVNVAIFVRS